MLAATLRLAHCAVGFGLGAWRWGASLALFGLLIAFGLFFFFRRMFSSSARRVRELQRQLAGKLADQELREEIRVSCEYVLLIFIVPVLAACVGTVRLLQRIRVPKAQRP